MVRGAGFGLWAYELACEKVDKYWGLTGDLIVISTLLPLVLPFSSMCSFIRFLKNQPRVRESLLVLGFLGSNFVLSVDGVLDEEPLAVEVDEDDEDDSVSLDNGDLPGCLGRGATIVSSVREAGTDPGLILTGEEDTDCNVK